MTTRLVTGEPERRPQWGSTQARTVPRTSPTYPAPGCTSSAHYHPATSPTCSPYRPRPVDPDKFPGLSAYDTRAGVFGTRRRVVLTHSETLHAAQAAGFTQTLAKATRALGE